MVVKSKGTWLEVRTVEGTIINCKLKGNFRLKDIKSTNPLAVGDNVEFDLFDDSKSGLIKKILPRTNYIIRKATKLSKVSHIIAANLDQAMIIVTLAYPRTSTGFIDRFLVTTEAYHIPAILVFNKTDLYGEEMLARQKEFSEIYSDIGYPCYEVSALRGDNLEKLKSVLKNKKTLLSGHSGVGKTELINALQPGINLKTRDLSGYHQKGMHTTTFAEMYLLSFGGFIVDTPGIKEFGLTDFKKTEIAERFPEMRKYMHDCRFANCTHVHEPGCAVKEALDKNEISMSRYKNYISILKDDYWAETEGDYRST